MKEKTYYVVGYKLNKNKYAYLSVMRSGFKDKPPFEFSNNLLKAIRYDLENHDIDYINYIKKLLDKNGYSNTFIHKITIKEELL